LVLFRSEDLGGLAFEELLLVLQSQLAELGVSVEVSDGEGPTASGIASTADESSAARLLGLVWLERRSDALIVHFYEPAGTRMRDRRIPLRSTDSTSIEQVAIVVRSAAAALLERFAWEAKRKENDAASRAAKQTKPLVSPSEEEEQMGDSPAAIPTGDNNSNERSHRLLGVDVAYSPSWFATGVPVQHGVYLGLGYHLPGSGFVLGASYTWLPPFSRSEQELTFRFVRHPVQLQVGFELELSDRISARLGGGVGLDAVVRSAQSSSSQWEVSPRSERVLATVSAQARVGMRLFSHLSLFASAGMDVALNPYSAVIFQQDGTGQAMGRELWSTYTVRPSLLLGLSAYLP